MGFTPDPYVKVATVGVLRLFVAVTVIIVGVTTAFWDTANVIPESVWVESVTLVGRPVYDQMTPPVPLAVWSTVNVPVLVVSCATTVGTVSKALDAARSVRVRDAFPPFPDAVTTRFCVLRYVPVATENVALLCVDPVNVTPVGKGVWYVQATVPTDATWFVCGMVNVAPVVVSIWIVSDGYLARM
jgi:hypothetical protein